MNKTVRLHSLNAAQANPHWSNTTMTGNVKKKKKTNYQQERHNSNIRTQVNRLMYTFRFTGDRLEYLLKGS